MTQKIAWIIDSLGYLSPELAARSDVFVAPLTIHFGTDSYVDGESLTTDELYEKINTTKSIPTTSQPSAGYFEKLYRSLKEEGYDCAIAVHISSKLSGTFASSNAGAELANFTVHTVDSLSMSYGMTYMLERGIETYEETKSIEQTMQVIQNLVAKLQNYILIGKLDQLYKGGRMSGVQYFLGSLLKMKPVVHMNNEGLLIPYDKVRSEKRGVQYLIDRVTEKANQMTSCLYIMHGNVEERAIALKEAIHKQIPNLDIRIGEISSSIAVHAGEETLAILWFEDDGTTS